MVLQVRPASFSVLLWQRGPPPFEGAWSLPGGYLERGHTLEESIRGQLARKVDVAELSWLEQLETVGDPARHPDEWQLATAYLGLVPLGLDPALPRDTAWHPVEPPARAVAFDHEPIVLAGRERLRAKLSYTNIGFALAPERVLDLRAHGDLPAALGYPWTPPTCVACSSAAGCSRPPASGARPVPRAGGRPRSTRSGRSELAVTDPFAVLRPPGERTRIEQQADVERRRGVRERADADEVDAGLGHRPIVSSVIRRTPRAPPGRPRRSTASAQLVRAHVVEQHARHARQPAPPRTSSSVAHSTSTLTPGGAAFPSRARPPAHPPASAAWFSLTSTASYSPARWLTPPPARPPPSRARAGPAWSCGCRGSGRRCPPPPARSGP